MGFFKALFILFIVQEHAKKYVSCNQHLCRHTCSFMSHVCKLYCFLQMREVRRRGGGKRRAKADRRNLRRTRLLSQSSRCTPVVSTVWANLCQVFDIEVLEYLPSVFWSAAKTSLIFSLREFAFLLVSAILMSLRVRK